MLAPLGGSGLLVCVVGSEIAVSVHSKSASGVESPVVPVAVTLQTPGFAALKLKLLSVTGFSSGSVISSVTTLTVFVASFDSTYLSPPVFVAVTPMSTSPVELGAVHCGPIGRHYCPGRCQQSPHQPST